MIKIFTVCVIIGVCCLRFTVAAPRLKMKCLPCELFCRGVDTHNLNVCNPTCMCEPEKDIPEVKPEVLCQLHRCEYCILGYKTDDNGCRLCECLDKPPDNVS